MSEAVYSAHDEARPTPAPEAVHERLLAWFALYGRDLPWRHIRDPYAILVAEMMLQQTGVDRVRPKYEAWLERFPTLRALAEAPKAEVIRLWSGLGYNSRAVRLQGIAREAIDRFDGRLPGTVAELLTLKGIGPYTAGAVACFAFEQDVAFVDTNVRRVLSRVFIGVEGAPSLLTDKEMSRLAEGVLPRGRAWGWHQALMDLGATVCMDAKPACLVCPLQDLCRAAFRAGRLVRESSAGYKPRRKEGPWLASTRYYRGRIVAALTSLPPGERMALETLAARVATANGHDPSGDSAWLRDLVTRLAADGLASIHQSADGSIEVALPE